MSPNAVARLSGAWTRGVLEAFQKLGLDVEELCRQIGVKPQVFTDPSRRVPRDATGRLWRAALVQGGDRFLGLSTAEVWEPRANHLVLLLLMTAETFGEGLEVAIRYQELLSHGRVMTLGEGSPHHPIHINKVEYELPVTAHEIEFLAASFMKIFRFATGGAFRTREVHFQHPYRGNIEQYRRAFDCPVSFGRKRNTLLVEDDVWKLPTMHGNKALHAQLCELAASLHVRLELHGFIDSVRDRIKELLPKGLCDIDAVASALHMTPRTLQRRLQEEGTSFRVLVEATRKSIVLDCVERNHTPEEMVRHTGYTNPRSFRRALKRWNLRDLDTRTLS